MRVIFLQLVGCKKEASGRLEWLDSALERSVRRFSIAL